MSRGDDSQQDKKAGTPMKKYTRLSLTMYIDKEEDVLPIHEALVEVVEKFSYNCFISSAPEEKEKGKER